MRFLDVDDERGAVMKTKIGSSSTPEKMLS
jgi:hypothetical protein